MEYREKRMRERERDYLKQEDEKAKTKVNPGLTEKGLREK